MSNLYHNRVLELAASIPHVGALEGAHGSVEKVSRICGSTVRVDITLSEDGKTVEGVAVDPKACALGQAATAIFAEHAVGASVEEIVAARDALNHSHENSIVLLSPACASFDQFKSFEVRGEAFRSQVNSLVDLFEREKAQYASRGTAA